jgi:hypothetical protein
MYMYYYIGFRHGKYTIQISKLARVDPSSRWYSDAPPSACLWMVPGTVDPLED